MIKNDNYKINRSVINILFFIVILLCVSGCKKYNNIIKNSIGKPFYLLIVGDLDNKLRDVLDVKTEYLPQPEPAFDLLSVSKDKYVGDKRKMRNIIILNVNKKLYHNININCKENVYAYPQTIITINVPNTDVLKQQRKKIQRQINRIVLTAEKKWQIINLKKKHNTKAKLVVKKMFNRDILIAPEMTSMKCAKQFVWFSDNDPVIMQNICIYKINGQWNNIGKQRADSAMKKNIKGETDDMYWKPNKTYISKNIKTQDKKYYILERGLWEVHNDAMGGAFIRKVIIEKHYFIVAVAFVYAPGKNKRNIMNKAEAMLYTLK